MSRGPLPPKCCFKCGHYISPPEDYRGPDGKGMCREYDEVTDERDCCEGFEMGEDD